MCFFSLNFNKRVFFYEIRKTSFWIGIILYVIFYKIFSGYTFSFENSKVAILDKMTSPQPTAAHGHPTNLARVER